MQEYATVAAALRLPYSAPRSITVARENAVLLPILLEVSDFKAVFSGRCEEEVARDVRPNYSGITGSYLPAGLQEGSQALRGGP